MTSQPEAEIDSLKRVFGLKTLVIYGVGDILGAGIYAVVGKIAGLSGTMVWASFLIAMLVAALTALSYAELGGRLPKSGGVAYFIHEAFRTEWLSMLVGWLMFCTCLVSMATLSLAFAGYLNAFAPVIPSWAIVLALFGGLAWVNFRGMQESSLVNIICTTLEVSGLVIVILVSAAFLFGGSNTPQPLPAAEAVSITAILQGAALAFYAFIGFEDIVNVAEEVKSPERNVPRAILIALTIAGIIYILVSWLATQVLTPAELGASKAPLLDVVRRAQPNFPDLIFTVIALFAVLNTALLNFVTASRLMFGMAREGLLPASDWLGKLHPERLTPYRTFLVILPIAILLALSGTIQFLAQTTATLILVLFMLVNLSLVTIKRREPQIQGFQVPWIIPALALVSNALLITFASQASHLLSLAFTAVGLTLIGIHQAILRKQQSPV